MNHALPIAAEELEGQCLGLSDDADLSEVKPYPIGLSAPTETHHQLLDACPL